jgi:hypothetical protein
MSPPTDTTALVRRIEQLEARLDAAESVQQICDLKARYGAVTDRRYTGDGVAPADELEAIAHEVAGMFTRDGIWDGGEQLGRCEGRDAIYQRFLQPTLHFAWHFFVKPRIEVRGNEAEGTWDVFAPCTGADGRWLHSYMKLDMVFMAPYDRSWSRRWAQQQRSPRSPQSG